MSLDSSNERIETADSRTHSKTSITCAVVAVVAVMAILGASMVVAGKRFSETSSACTATLSGSDVRIGFEGPTAFANCSQWVADFNEHGDAWTKTWFYERFETSSSSIVCTLVQGKDTARVSDSGLGLIGSLACLSLETDGWEEIATSD